MAAIEFKYQTMFTCSVPAGVIVVKDFSEIISSNERLSSDEIVQTIKLSFENADIRVDDLIMSADMGHCDVYISGEDFYIRVIIRVRASLVVGDLIFKLDELDI
jgi:hypothetical protein